MTRKTLALSTGMLMALMLFMFACLAHAESNGQDTKMAKFTAPAASTTQSDLQPSNSDVSGLTGFAAIFFGVGTVAAVSVAVGVALAEDKKRK